MMISGNHCKVSETFKSLMSPGTGKSLDVTTRKYGMLKTLFTLFSVGNRKYYWFK